MPDDRPTLHRRMKDTWLVKPARTKGWWVAGRACVRNGSAGVTEGHYGSTPELALWLARRAEGPTGTPKPPKRRTRRRRKRGADS